MKIVMSRYPLSHRRWKSNYKPADLLRNPFLFFAFQSQVVVWN
jgi:hypothetical protein